MAAVNVTVVVHSAEESQIRVFVLPASSSVGTVLSRYTQELGLTPDAGNLVDDAGSSIPDGQLLSDVGEVDPGRRIVALTFQQKQELRVELLGSSDSWSLLCRLSRSPASLLPEIERLVGVEGRQVRFLSSHGVLEPDLPLENQTGDSTMVVELGMDLQVRDAWTGVEVTLDSVFPGDLCRDVLRRMLTAIEEKVEEMMEPPEDEEEEEEETFLPPPSVDMDAVRLSDGRTTLSLRGSVIEALGRLGAPHQRVFCLVLESRRAVTVVDGGRVSCGALWPSEKVASLAEGRALMCGDQVVDVTTKGWDADLVDDGVVVKDPLLLTLSVTKGNNFTIRAPRWATVGDVRRVARRLTNSKQVHLRRRRSVFEDDSLALDLAGLVPDPALTVDLNTMTLSVRLKREQVDWCPHKHRLTFEDLVSDLLPRCHDDYTTLKSSVLECSGCGRRVWWDEERGVIIPVKCCPTQSTVLTLCCPTKQGLSKQEMAARWAVIQQLGEARWEAQTLRQRLTEVSNDRKTLEERVQTLEIQLRQEEVVRRDRNDGEKLQEQERIVQDLLQVNETLKNELEKRGGVREVEEENRRLKERLREHEEMINDRVKENEILASQFRQHRDLIQDQELLKENLQKQENVIQFLRQKLRQDEETQKKRIEEVSQENETLKRSLRDRERTIHEILQENENLKGHNQQQRTMVEENSRLKDKTQRQEKTLLDLYAEKETLEMECQRLRELAPESGPLTSQLQKQEGLMHEILQENEKLQKQVREKEMLAKKLSGEVRALKDRGGQGRGRERKQDAQDIFDQSPLKPSQIRTVGRTVAPQRQKLVAARRNRSPDQNSSDDDLPLAYKVHFGRVSKEETAQSTQTQQSSRRQKTTVVRGATAGTVRRTRSPDQESSFRIWNQCNDFANGRDYIFAIDFDLPPRPTVGSVRAAVCAHMGRTLQSTGLRRWVAESAGDLVFEISASRYADCYGNVRKMNSVKNAEMRVLANDSDPFTVVPGHENVLIVFPIT